MNAIASGANAARPFVGAFQTSVIGFCSLICNWQPYRRSFRAINAQIGVFDTTATNFQIGMGGVASRTVKETVRKKRHRPIARLDETQCFPLAKHAT